MSDTLKEKLESENGKVKMDGEIVTGIVLDAELDPVNCFFGLDDCVTLDTRNLNEIKLDFETLQTLMEMIEQAEVLYE